MLGIIVGALLLKQSSGIFLRIDIFPSKNDKWQSKANYNGKQSELWHLKIIDHTGSMAL
jgi:hypothetical protein